MAMGARQQRERQQGLWIAAAGIRRGGGHPLKELIRNEASPGGTALSPPHLCRISAGRSRKSGKTAIVTPTTTGREVVVYIRLQCELGGSGFEPQRHKEHKATQSGFFVFLGGLCVFVVNGSES
jgi:hypothetical protein